MRILFDQGTPVPLRHRLAGHAVRTAYEEGCADPDNGRLLAAAEAEFDALLTTDQNIRYQRNVVGRRLAILVLPTTSWPKIQEHIELVIVAVNSLRAGDFVELRFEPNQR
jgi:hypothetical protein